MKLSALVFLALLGLAEQIKFKENANLEWVTWNGSLPSGAVYIYNEYTNRHDYVCKFRCEAGFYNPSLPDRYCRYALNNNEYTAYPFEILANKDNFEILEWKEADSSGLVPQDSVRTCPGKGRNTYVGKNKYGLGKVDPQDKTFYLPWKGSQWSYSSYEVLTFNTDVYSQRISDVKYLVNEAKIIQDPPQALLVYKMTNNQCQSVKKNVQFTKTIEKESTWNIIGSIMLCETGSITAEIPVIVSGTITFATQLTLQFDYRASSKETESHSLSMQLTAPPNHYFTVRLEGRKIKSDIPYTARLTRTYHNGEIKWTSITGMYHGVQTGDFQSVVGRFEPVAHARPCNQSCVIPPTHN